MFFSYATTWSKPTLLSIAETDQPAVNSTII